MRVKGEKLRTLTYGMRISKRGLGFCDLMVILGSVTSYPSNTDRIMTATGKEHMLKIWFNSITKTLVRCYENIKEVNGEKPKFRKSNVEMGEHIDLNRGRFEAKLYSSVFYC